MGIGDRIREMRKASGISQVQLSKLTGIAQSSISDIERQTNNPSAITLQLIAKALGCSVADLIDTEKETPTAMGDGLKTKVISRLNDLSSDELQRVDDFLSGLQSARKGH